MGEHDTLMGRRQLIGWALGAMAPLACRGGSSVQENATGRWRLIVLDSVDAVRPAPAAAASPSEERAELADIQRRRRDPRAVDEARFWAAGASLRWNEIARDLVASQRTHPMFASRVYALVSVAQYDALVTCFAHQASEHAAVAGASAAVLSYLYPGEARSLEVRARAHQQSRLVAGVSLRREVVAGDALGRQVAERVIARARADGSNVEWKGQIPVRPGAWSSAVGDRQQAQWGQVRPWLMSSGAQFRAPPPPAYGSPAFQAALAEIKHLSEARTQEQTRLAALWADGPGSYTPAGRWNKIACDLCRKYRLDEAHGVRLLALLNMALMDAGITCFETKYFYWVIRPSQVDPTITTPVGLPDFPSYTSAHSTFSAAAARLLGFLFPADAHSLDGAARDASMSRLYGGIHYRFDAEGGTAQGRAVAELAIVRAQTDGAV